MSLKKRVALAAVIALTALAIGGVYRYISSGGLIARQTPGSIEAAAAHWVLNLSVSSKAKTLENPFGMTDASVTAGRVLYRQKCEFCHGYDGSGNTESGGGTYPPPRDLRGQEITKATDGELFYFIRNGIRNTAMPGWQMPDQNIWQLIVFVRNLPKVVSASTEVPVAKRAVSTASAQYAGSAACKACHSSIYERGRNQPCPRREHRQLQLRHVSVLRAFSSPATAQLNFHGSLQSLAEVRSSEADAPSCRRQGFARVRTLQPPAHRA